MSERKIILPTFMEGQRIRLELVTNEIQSLLHPYRNSPQHCLMQFGCSNEFLDEAINTEQKACSFGVRAYYKALPKDQTCTEHHGEHVRLDFHDEKIVGIHGGMAHYQENQSRSWVEAFCLPLFYLFANGFELAITNTRADNLRAIHFLKSIGFEVSRETHFIQSESNPLSCNQIHLSCNPQQLFNSSIVQRIFKSKPIFGKPHEIVPKRLPYDHTEVQLSVNQQEQVSRLIRGLDSKYFIFVDPENSDKTIAFIHEMHLHQYFLSEFNHQEVSPNELIHHLQMSYKINTNRYFVLKNEAGKYYGLLSIFLSGGHSLAVHLKCNILDDEAKQSDFEKAHNSLIKTLFDVFSPARIQVETKRDQKSPEILWEKLGYQKEGLDTHKKWLIWGFVK